MTDPTTEPDEQLVEAVARAIAIAECDPAQPGHNLCGDSCTFTKPSPAKFLGWHDEARAAIAAVRDWDAEHDWSVDNDPGLPPAEPRNVKHYRATIHQEQP